MEFKFNNLTDLLLTFNTEEKCISYLEKQRWNGKVTCPHCEHDKVYRTNRGYKCASPECYKKFTVKVGTYFEASNIKLQKWFAAIYLATAHKKGISSCQLARDLGVAQKTAWFMLHRIRAVMTVERPDLMTGEVQADETYIGGKTKNMHAYKREIVHAAGSSGVHMNPVLGMRDEQGIVRSFPIPEPNGKTIKPVLFDNIDPSATLVTDGQGSYAGLHKHFDRHIVVNHEAGQYTNCGYHTNGIENYWSMLKRGIYGIYHQVSGKHLQAYCNEFAFRYNNRKITDNTRFSLSLTQVKGRLSYKQLVYGNQEKSS